MADTCATCACTLGDGEGPICPQCLTLASSQSTSTDSEKNGISPVVMEDDDSVQADVAICMAGCTRKSSDKRLGITKCMWCHYPYHKLCVTDVYICDTCRTMPANITSLNESINNLASLVKTLTDSNIELRTTVSTHTDTICRLEKRVASISSSPTPTSRDLLIGSSVVRDIDPAKLVNTDVISISGGRIRDVRKRLEDTSATYGRVSIVVGGNDCAAKTDPEPFEELVEQYKALVDHAKSVSTEVIVGTVLPRDNQGTPGASARIDALNAALLPLDATHGVTIVNNDSFFKLGNASLNDGYYNSDLTHLNKAGTNRLVTNMQLNTKPQHAKNVCRDYSQAVKGTAPKPRRARSVTKTQINTKQSSPRQTPDRNSAPAPQNHRQIPGRRTDDADRSQSPGPARSNWDHRYESDADDGSWRTVDHSRKSRDSAHDDHHRSACEYCNERNHDKHTCHHGRSVKCDTCHGYGHKAKHHSGNNY